MSENLESMFYVREAPWHGLGTRVEAALDSKEALEKSGLDWKVVQKPIMTAHLSLFTVLRQISVIRTTRFSALYRTGTRWCRILKPLHSPTLCSTRA